MSTSRAEAERVMQQADCLFSKAEVEGAIDAMAKKIDDDMRDGNVVVLCVMNGGLIMTAALLARLHFPLRVDYLHATRYRERTAGDDLHWKTEPTQDLAGKDVLVIDDILDEGYTLDAILGYCRAKSPASLRSAVLIEKQHTRGVNPNPDYIGLQVPDRYVFGYGMDYKGYWRNAPGIYAAAD
jgi:hypoxanthine phosphoribosyltransferase